MKYQQVKKVKCPNCNAELNVKNSKDEKEKYIECPSCKAQLKVNFHEILEAPTVLPPTTPRQGGATQLGGGYGNGETQLGCGSSGGGLTQLPDSRLPRHAAILFDGKEYPLKAGSNIVGRKSPNRYADVALPTNDVYMSRQHVEIFVSCDATGGITDVTIRNYRAKNTTKVGMTKMENDEVLRLSDGDSITLSSTTLIFKLY